MAVTTVTGRVHIPSLVTELPDGWTVTERASLSSPSGISINLRVDRVPEGSDASGFAAQMDVAARAEVPGIDAMTENTVPMFGGRVGEERRFSCERNGVPWNGRIVCLVEGEVALTASAWWDASIDTADAEVDAVISTVRLRSRPVVEMPAAAARPEANGRRRTPVPTTAWSTLRNTWATADSAAAATRGPTRWSPAELAVCATILGSSAFPTVGPDLLVSMPRAALSATLEAVTRSLLARGLVHPTNDGGTALAAELEASLSVAVFPDLTILVERLGGDSNARWWLGLSPDRAVQVTVLPDGSRECGELDPERVVGHVLALAGGSSATNGDGQQRPARDRVNLDRVNLEDVGGGSGEVAALVRISTSWRDGDRILNGTFTCAVGHDGATWLAEPEPEGTGTSPAWKLCATDLAGLRGQLLAHLPGA